MKFYVCRLSEPTLRSATELACQHIFEETGEPADYGKTFNFLIEAEVDGAVFVACADKHVVGLVVGLWNTHERHYEVKSLYVDERYRGGDCAQCLLRALLTWATNDDAPVYIATVGEPRSFYRALGFEPTHIVSRASLKTLRERIGGKDELPGANPRGSGGTGADEPGQERPEPGAGV